MFSWSKHKTTAYPGGRSGTGSREGSRISRSDHLQSYLEDVILKPSTRGVSKDDTTYDTVFQTKGGHALILRVHFSHESSAGGQLPPAMTLVGVKARHPWLDERMRVTGYPPIESEGQWGASRMRLGAAVNAVVQHLQLNPPSSIRIIDESLQKIQSSIGQPQPDEDQPQPQQQQQSSPAHGGPASEPPPDYNTVLQDEEEIDDVLRDIAIPEVPSLFPEVDGMTEEEMQELLEDGEKFRSYLGKLPSVQGLFKLQSSVREGNVSIAEENLAREVELTALHEEVSSLQTGLAERLDEFRALEAKQALICSPPDRRDVVRKLTAAKRQAYKESEELASDWVDANDGRVDDFFETFMEGRIVHHMRAAKLERLNATA